MGNKQLKLLFMAGCLLASISVSRATPPNSAILDGQLLEYDSVDLAATFQGAVGDPANLQPWGPNNMITNVYVTWDEEYIYIAVRGWVEVNGNANKLGLLLDIDPGNGTGISTTTNWTGNAQAYLAYNGIGWMAYDPAEFGADYMLATEGVYNDVIRILYDAGTPGTNNTELIFSADNGSAPRGTPIDMVTRTRQDPVSFLLNGFEARIPWTNLYDRARFGAVESGESVPRGARLRLIGNVHVNNPGQTYSSPVVVPLQGSNSSYTAVGSTATFVSDTYAEVVIDSDTNGVPDVFTGDVNAPWLRIIQGASGQSLAYARFNEAVDQTTAEVATNWLVNGLQPLAAERIEPDLVKLSLSTNLPSASAVEISAQGVEDADGNSKFTFNYFTPSSGGLTNAVEVTFVLETFSGMGRTPGASNYFVNGSAFPLEWGFPPAKNNPLAQQGGTLYTRTINFLPGSSTQIFYKYSAEMRSGAGRGTNNYEGIRLLDHTEASRVLNLSDGVNSLTITDYLGAAAAPWRNDVYTNGYENFYYDSRRGDAGVRENKQVLFTVDLSARSLKGARVVLVGSDPLRGFNDSPEYAFDNGQHWYDNPDLEASLDWSTSGMTMFDDATHGDLVAGDGIYSSLADFTVDGTSGGQSLVGSGPPYQGFWVDARSPRSFDYKFVVYRPNSTDPVLYSPLGGNLTHYLPDGDTNIVMETHIWSNENLPFPDAESDPVLVNIVVSNDIPRVEFINEPTEFQHGVQVSADLSEGFRDHGLRGVFTNGIWSASMPGPVGDHLFYRAYAGPAPARATTWWTPNPVPATGATVQVWFSQINRETRGQTQVYLRSPLMTNGVIDYSGSWVGRPMTFVTNGLWTIQMEVAALPEGVTKQSIQFGITETPDSFGGLWDENWWPGGSESYRIIVGSRTSWSPERPAAGSELTITYDATGGALEGGTNIWIHSGYNKFEGADWTDAYQSPMTNLSGEVWTTTVTMPTNGFKTFNMLFRDLSDTNAIVWDNEYDQLHWVVFPESVE